MERLRGLTSYFRFTLRSSSNAQSEARGSCWEVLDHLITSVDEGILDKEHLAKGREEIYTIVKLIKWKLCVLSELLLSDFEKSLNRRTRRTG